MSNRIDKEQVRRRFSRHLAVYDSLAVVQQQIAATLAGYFSGQGVSRLGRVLEVGCGTGFLTRELLKAVTVDHLYVNDLVEEAVPALRGRLQEAGFAGTTEGVPGDAEQLLFPGGLDLVASASVMQWFEDLPGFFRKTAESLRPGGWFVFNLFGPDNLHQVRALTGSGLDYLSPEVLRALAEEHFGVADFRRETIRQGFEVPFDVLRHLQQTGVTATGGFRWTPGALRVFEHEYASRYGADGKVWLDWDVIYVVARKQPESPAKE